MDQYTRRIIGFGVHAGVVDGVAICRMFNQAIRGHLAIPKYLSSDHDPLYRFKQWEATLRILDVAEIKAVPYVPLSHPFVERLCLLSQGGETAESGNSTNSPHTGVRRLGRRRTIHIRFFFIC